jgi:hypothetical protein
MVTLFHRTRRGATRSILREGSAMALAPRLCSGVWVSAAPLDQLGTADGAGNFEEISQPVLVDSKHSRATATTRASLHKLVRDAKVRGRRVALFVVDELAEALEVGGPYRVRKIEHVLVVLSSFDSFVMDLRLLAPALRELIETPGSDDPELLADAAVDLGEALSTVTLLTRAVEGVCRVLEVKVLSVLRDQVLGPVCTALRERITRARTLIKT